MGCLFGFPSFIIDCLDFIYEELMLMILPNKKISPIVHAILELTITAFSGLCIVSFFLGLIMQINDDSFTRYIGRYLIFIPLGLSVLQIVLGVVVKIRSKRK